jgi:CRISPR type I-A-associated protein Csa5
MSETEFKGIENVLRAFAQMGVYGPLDRMAGALTPEAVENALYDALRTINAYARQAEILKIKKDEKELEVEVIDVGKPDDPRYRLAEEGEIVEVIRGSRGLEKGERIRFIRTPYMPADEELKAFISRVRQGFEGLRLARELALRALTPFRR